MSDSENVDDFSGKLTIIVNKLRSLGNSVEDEKVVKKLLRSVSSKFLQIASTIEEFSDLTTKSIEEVIGSLKAHEERLLSCGGRSDETVLLTRAEWKIYFEEPSLMMIDAVELNGVQGEAYVAATSGCLMKGAGWYLDTGATNHMTGDKHCFVEIDDSICGKVKFGDGSVN
ncbi:hypothetical protein GH714_034915 [Hevea brasiliensis]|uniref:Retrovirus-related Pol polyprotein from transposon TNT 1-94-like beta-barrel domain-containing protein n=1 Tax=Hevea brasiliensis TaxID=3981 RepID=A0A6A6NB16_HEVBR|nr:hypothetical protein GH714_034915 [Hevea brasiliensis]